MTQPLSPMEIFKLLNKSNCRQCGEATCMAFAAAVFRGEKSLRDCPYLDEQTVSKYRQEDESASLPESQEEQEKLVQQLKSEISSLDLSEVAERVSGELSNHSLKIYMLGKPVYVFGNGELYSDIHLNPWVVLPLLHHLLYGTGAQPIGKWISFREIQGGMSWNGLFQQRSTKPLKKVLDNYSELFEDVLTIFKGQRVDSQFGADIGVVLYPLPKVPVLFNYRKPEEEFESSLHIFFDKTVDSNISIQAAFSLCTGLVRMFEQIALRHGRHKEAHKRC